MRAVATLEDFRSWAAERLPALAFAGPDPHYAIGLDRLVPDLRIACAEETPASAVLRAAGVAVWTPLTARGEAGERSPAAADAPDPAAGAPAGAIGGGGDEPDDAAGEGGRSALGVLSDPRAAAFLAPAAASGLVVFKSSHALERFAAARGWPLLAAPAALGRRWENKVAFRARAAAMGLPQPAGVVVELAEARYAALAERLGPRLVVQAAHGYAGNRTVAVTGAAELERVRRTLRARQVRITAWVAGRALTLNACVTARGTAVGAPFDQLTGVPALTPFPLGSCGQRWSAGPDDPPAEVAEACVELAGRLGAALAADGYRGFFGVDFVAGDDGDVRVIEVNPRLVASVAAYTQLELAEGRLPLLARHLMARVEPAADVAPLAPHRAPLGGGQLVAHNVAGAPRRLAAPLAAGVYRVAEGASPTFHRPAAHLAALAPAGAAPGAGVDEVLVLPPAPDAPIAPAAAWARVQARRPMSGPDGELDALGRAVTAWLGQRLAP